MEDYKLSDMELIVLIKNKPEEGIRKAMDKYSKPIHTICKNFLFDLPNEDIEETVGDVFVKLWANIDKFKDYKGSLKSYLFQIARNTSINIRRKKKLTQALPIEETLIDSNINIENEYEKKYYENILHETLESFTEPERTIFIMRYFYCEKVKSIASKMDINPKRIENILFRTKSKLKELLIDRGINNDTCR